MMTLLMKRYLELCFSGKMSSVTCSKFQCLFFDLCISVTSLPSVRIMVVGVFCVGFGDTGAYE